MRNTHVCPKCGNNDIVHIEGPVLPSGGGNYIPAAFPNFPVLVHRYICAKCGYSEEWIDTSDILDVRKSRYRVEF